MDRWTTRIQWSISGIYEVWKWKTIDWTERKRRIEPSAYDETSRRRVSKDSSTGYYKEEISRNNTVIEALIEHVKNVIETRANDENAGIALRKTQRDIELTLADCKSAHQIKWIRRIQTRYNEIIEKFKLSPP